MQQREFKIGDIVEYTKEGRVVKKGMVGKIKNIDFEILVKWRGFTDGHGGRSKYGTDMWWVLPGDITLAKREIMKEILSKTE